MIPVVFIVIAGVIALVLIAGRRAQSRLRTQYPPVGQMVDVGGYKMHIHVQGEGEITVIMDAGAGGIGLHWALVQPEIARFARAVVYDRAGMGWSERSPKPRTAEVMAQELHTLLTRAGILAPYVLVGHSFGGVVMRQFVQQHPGEVVGMVLVDSAHEQQFQHFPQPIRDIAKKMQPMMKLMRLLFWAGIPALRVASMSLDKRIPRSIAEVDRAVRAVSARHFAALLRLADLFSAWVRVRTSAFSLSLLYCPSSNHFHNLSYTTLKVALTISNEQRGLIPCPAVHVHRINKET